MSRPHAQHIPMLARGQMEVASGPGTSRSIPAGTPGDVLTVGADGMPAFAGAPGGVSFTSAGQLVYGTGAGTSAFLPIGTAGQQLVVSAGLPTWVDAGGVEEELNPADDTETATNRTYSGAPVLMRRLEGATGGVATVQTVIPSFVITTAIELRVRFVDSSSNVYFTTSEVGVYRFRVVAGNQIEINVSEGGINGSFELWVYYV